MYGIYANIGGILVVNVTIYIAAPWILWVSPETPTVGKYTEFPVGQPRPETVVRPPFPLLFAPSNSWDFYGYLGFERFESQDTEYVGIRWNKPVDRIPLLQG